MKHPNSRALVVAALVAVFAIWWMWPSSQSKTSSAQGGDFDTLANRIWIDHIPADERDKIDLFILLDDPTIGAFTKSSAYEGDWAAFEWSIEKGLVISMLQAQTKHRMHPKVARGATCAPFDYCMKLEGAPRGSKTYGSMEDWVVNDLESFDLRKTVLNLVAAD
ncbi:MAG: hypothetical protein GY811_24260 [Myxococcales bacterium]|nr:hypothetical protein [Myxococcales bacterium]